MPLYFLVHDGRRFHEEIRPPLAAAWQQRTFDPCRTLCASLVDSARTFAARFHVGDVEALLVDVSQGLAFDRYSWRHVVGEVLLYAAVDVPEFPTAADTLCCLLAPENYRAGDVARDGFTPIEQAHFGARDLVLGGGYYRPVQAGWNDVADVRRLTEYLGSVPVERWSPEDLAGWRAAADPEETAEEVEFARECLASLHELYQRSASAGQLIICEAL